MYPILHYGIVTALFFAKPEKLAVKRYKFGAGNHSLSSVIGVAPYPCKIIALKFDENQGVSKLTDASH
jgi:hypothetical protein